MPIPKTSRKVFIKPRWIFKYPKGVGYGVMRSVYDSFSGWNTILYPQIVARAPIAKDGRNPGLIKTHLKLMWTTGEQGIRYKAIGVPGGTVKGSPAYHALMAIMTLHGGRAAVTITGKKMTFPLGKAQIRNPKTARQGPGRTRGPRNWVFTQRVVQKARGPRNQWITNTFESNKQILTNLLRQCVLAQRKKPGQGKAEKIEIG